MTWAAILFQRTDSILWRAGYYKADNDKVLSFSLLVKRSTFQNEIISAHVLKDFNIIPTQQHLCYFKSCIYYIFFTEAKHNRSKKKKNSNAKVYDLTLVSNGSRILCMLIHLLDDGGKPYFEWDPLEDNKHTMSHCIEWHKASRKLRRSVLGHSALTVLTLRS